MNIKEIKKNFYFARANIVTHSKKKTIMLCKQSYYKHPNGCPNFNKKEDCPIRAKEFLNNYHNIGFLAIIDFHFKDYISQKRKIHPDWSNRALMNQRHWQPHLRAELKKEILGLNLIEEYVCLYSPEAMGIDLQKTLLKNGFEDMEWAESDKDGNIIYIPKYMYQIAIIAERKL